MYFHEGLRVSIFTLDSSGISVQNLPWFPSKELFSESIFFSLKFKKQFWVHSKVKMKYRAFLHIPLPGPSTCIASTISNIPHQRSTCYNG